ncbi:MAG: SDR family NAD(P)-dependent oxidoreductase [Sedimentisphaerales bacterium]|nr:SDR family NAD(P)-dependent oxidoreductase [Sedimentisphaerales bacterium]
MKVLVTGGAGFIGSHLCERLLANGHGVIALDNFDAFYDPQVKRNNIAECIAKKEFTLIEGDIRDSDSVEDIFNAGTIEMIFHLAAKAGVRPSIEDPFSYQEVNVKGTLVLLEAARKHGVKKFIFASSSSVYGNNKKVPFSESDNVDNPISPYAATKKAGELLCYTYHHLFNIDMVCLRFFTVYGPRQRPDLAIHKFAKLIERGEEIPVFGDGSMMRDFTYVDDIIDGIMASMRVCEGYEIYNLGESRPIRLDDLIGAIEKALGKKTKIKRLPAQPGDVNITYADVSKAIAKLGYKPKTLLQSGLAKFVEWFRETK